MSAVYSQIYVAYTEGNKEETNMHPTEAVKLTTGFHADIHTRVIQHGSIRTEAAFHLFS